VNKPSIVIVSGLSGSGKSVALRAIEDAGLFCVDNLPPQLIDSIASATTDKAPGVAVGIDVREKEFLPVIDSVLSSLREKYSVTIIFLEAETEVLMRRFKETRRPHPLMAAGDRDIKAAIEDERELLGPLRELADRIVDTSSYTPHQLRHLMLSLYARGAAKETLSLTLVSFGFKFGVPLNVDLLFDVRFLPNPHFVPELRELRGTDEEVRKFVLERPETEELIDRLSGLLNFLMPLYLKEGKSYLTIGIGCTGGRHRSPAIVEKIASLIRRDSVSVEVVHRDM
jgi:UPF0042 nucleotide-binding protein